jgi:DNA (cytosine-5)-methyltransferase 1
VIGTVDLFSGIGGFSEGLERTGGFETRLFCDNHPYARQVLSARWPGVPCAEDVRAIDGRTLRGAAAVCAGFPCQDISHAGGRVGIDGERSGLFYEVVRLADEIRPDWLLLENVSALLVRGLDRVLGALAEIGFDAWWDCLSASALGYPHARDRFWLVAYPAGLRRDQGERAAQEWRRLVRARSLGRPSPWAEAANDHEVRSGFVRTVDGLPHHVDRLDRLGNAVVPEIAELIGRAILASEAA